MRTLLFTFLNHENHEYFFPMEIVLHDQVFITGRRVAELEMHILLAQMMRNFRIEYRELEPVKFRTKLLYRPAGPMNLALTDNS